MNGSGELLAFSGEQKAVSSDQLSAVVKPMKTEPDRSNIEAIQILLMHVLEWKAEMEANRLRQVSHKGMIQA